VTRFEEARMSPSDVMLFERWRASRDADAFAEIVSRHAGMVYATCRRVLGNATDAEDAAQDCFVELMQTTRGARSSLAGWLYTIAVHRALDRMKTEKRRRTREQQFAAAQAATVEVQVDEVLAHIDTAIADLPDRLRTPIVLRFLEGRTHDSIAEELAVAESTVRYRLERGVEEVRKTLKRRGIAVAPAALAAALATDLAGAAPPTLTAAISKLAIGASNGGVAVSTGGAAAAGTAKLLGDLLSIKGLAIGGAVVGLVVLGTWVAQNQSQDDGGVRSGS
jgi:RNA polymerase sigma-70 factor (ECF subfamily)